MSVPKHKRGVAQTEFLKELLDLNVRCGQIVAKMPKKYRPNYGDHLIKECLRALQCAQMANSIYVSKDTPPFMMERRYALLHEAMEICTSIPTTATIFLELSKNADGFEGDCIDSEMFFAGICDRICALLDGLLKSDKQRYKKYLSENN